MECFVFRGAIDCYLVKRRYASNGSLALSIHSETEGPMSRLTVNLEGGQADDMHAYLDTNNLPDAAEVVEKLGIGKDTGRRRKSGWCEYPLFSFDLDAIGKYARRE